VRAQETPAGDGRQALTLAQLHEERDFLLRSLEDLERERRAGDIGDADYAALREDYTARAAAVLRAIDAGGAPEPPPAEPRPSVARRAARWVAVAGVVAVAVVAGLAVATSSGERLPGESATGSIRQGVAEKLARAHALDSQGKAAEALKLYDAVLREDPRNVEALAYRGWVLKRAGLADEALASLDRAVTIDPGYPDAHFFRGMVLYQDKGDPAAAVGEFDAFLAAGPPPEMAAAVREVRDRARGEISGR
jgi:tetratricopeptide (TPR) repeat protein